MRIIDQVGCFFPNIKEQSGQFGIEIETETKKYADYPTGFLKEKMKGGYSCPKLKGWEAKGDGSLRDFGIEYVFKQPYSYEESLEILDNFGEETSGIPFLPNSPSTSVHVHINMFNESFLTMANFCTLYVLFENVLLEYSGPSRRSNLFSLPTRCSEQVSKNIITMFQEIDKGKTKGLIWGNDAVKYAALNLARLRDLGSVEIRCFRGETDPAILKKWLGIINSLLVYSRNPGMNPRDIILDYRMRDIELFYSVFGDYASDLEGACDGMLSELIFKNLWYAGEIATSVPDWDQLKDRFAKEREDFLEKKKKYSKAYGEDEGLAIAQAEVNVANNALQQFMQAAPMVWNDLEPAEPEEDFDFDEED